MSDAQSHLGDERGRTFIWETTVVSEVLLKLLKFLFFTYRCLADFEDDVSLNDTSMQDGSLASFPSKFLNGDLQARFLDDFLDELLERRLEASFSVWLFTSKVKKGFCLVYGFSDVIFRTKRLYGWTFGTF